MGFGNLGDIVQKQASSFKKQLDGALSNDEQLQEEQLSNGRIFQPGIRGGQGILIQGIGGGTIEQNTYSVQFRNWWKALPYGFRYNPRDGRQSSLFMLPLNPQNIQVRTPFATNVVSTAYGTVEEHSEVRYFDIVISGNTGITPKYSQQVQGRFDASRSNIAHRQRFSYRNRSLIPSDAAGGFFRRTLNQAQGVIKQVQGVAAAIAGEDEQIETGVQQAYTGFAAFHNFFRFLLEYKRDTSGVANTDQRRQHPLQFLNYKDGSEYDAVIRDFSWTKSASDPFLYNYTIVMRCYNLRTIDKADGPVGLTQRYAELGLDGIETSSAFNRIAGGVGAAKNAAFGAIGVLSGGFGF